MILEMLARMGYFPRVNALPWIHGTRLLYMKEKCANSNFARLLHPLLQCNFTVEMNMVFTVEPRKCSLFIFLALHLII